MNTKILKMKRLILISLIVAFISAPAFATVSLGGWNEGDPRTTHQIWNTWDHVNTNGIWWDWNVTPDNENNTGTSVAHIKSEFFGQWGSLNGAEGFMDYTQVDVLLEISNFPGGEYKELWVEVWYAGYLDLESINAEGFGNESSYETVSLGLTENVFGFRIYPNPDKEHIEFSILGAIPNGLPNDSPNGSPTGFAYLLGMHVDTICTIPAPGAVLLGSIGISFVGWLKRRRSL